MSSVPKPDPREFLANAVVVAQCREAWVTFKQIVKDGVFTGQGRGGKKLYASFRTKNQKISLNRITIQCGRPLRG